MRCPACSFENASGIKFCGECGKPLAEAAKPGPPPDPRSYTPKHLAEKILTSRVRPRRRAQAGDRALRRREGLDGAGRAGRSRGVARDPRPLLRRSSPTACTASRARSTSTPATASWRSSARRSRTRTTRSAPATRRCTCATSSRRYADELRAQRGPQLLGAHGPQLRRGRRRQDRRRPAHGLHGAGAHRRPGAAHGAARRAADAST